MQDPPKNIFAVVLDKIHAANRALVAEGLLPEGIDQSRVQVEPPREAAHGDMATNAAMVLAKDAGKKRRSPASCATTISLRKSRWRGPVSSI
jgi:arginyl-tRNA synthetase